MWNLVITIPVSAEGENTSQNTEGMAEELANLVKSYSSLNPNDKKHIADIVTNKWGEFFTLTQANFVNPSSLSREDPTLAPPWRPSPDIINEISNATKTTNPSSTLAISDNQRSANEDDGGGQQDNLLTPNSDGNRPIAVGDRIKDSLGGSITEKSILAVIKAGKGCARTDLESFVDSTLRRWVTTGLWPEQHGTAQVDSCVSDIFFANMTWWDPETKKMICRLARVRLFSWFTEMKEMEKRSNSRQNAKKAAADLIFEKFYGHYWERISEKDKEVRRKRLQLDCKIGKKWCSLVNHFSPGILVVCGDNMNEQINSINFPFRATVGLVHLMRNEFPWIVNLSKVFDRIADLLIHKNGIWDNKQFTEWRSTIDADLQRVTSDLYGCSDWTIEQCSTSDLARVFNFQNQNSCQ